MKLYKYLYLLPSFAFMVTSCDLDEIPEGGTITSDQKDEIQSKDLLLFIAYIIKRDLPLSQIPVINRFIKKK